MMKKMSKFFVVGAVLLITVAAQAVTIDFEEITSADYAGLGFNIAKLGSDNMGIQGGLGNGDPGNWGIEGSNGSKFLGFWGNWLSFSGGYSGEGDTVYTSIYFTEANSSTRTAVDVTFDVLARSSTAGNIGGMLYGFRDGVLVNTQETALTATTINGYSEYIYNASFSSVDEIRYNSTHYGGLDNFVYGAETTVTPVPEPATLIILGFGSLLLRKRKRFAGIKA